MKKIYLLLLFVFGFTAFGQQKGISYQAVIINPNEIVAPGFNGTSIPLANKAICLSFQIVNSTNQVEYQESQSITTDGYGMVNVVIGTGTSGAGLVSTLEAVAWNQGNKKLVVGVNTDGVCSNYTEISNQVLNYTPYSFYALNADLKDGYVTDVKVAMGINPAKVGLGNVNNTSDANKPVSTATQTALNLKANTTDVTNGLALKEDISNKSSNIGLDAGSTTKYPSVKAIKDYVDAQTAAAGVADGSITSTKIANGTIVNADVSPTAAIDFSKLNIQKSDIVGLGLTKSDIGLTNVDNTSDANKPVSTATQTALNLKEDKSNKSVTTTLGTSNVLYPTQNAVKTYVDTAIAGATIVDADATTKGKVKLAGDLAGTADLPTVPGLALKAPLASPSFTGTVTAPTYASTPISLTYSGSTIDWDPAVGLNAAITLTQNSVLSFTANPPVGSYGTIVLTQDGTGSRTITLPTIAGITNQILGSTSTTSVTLSTAANAKDILNFYFDGTNCYWNIGQGYGTAASITTNFASGVTGTLAVANGGTGTTTLTGLVKGTGTTALTAAVAGTDYQAPITLTTSGSGAATLSGTTLNIPTTTNYTLPTSSASVIGGVKVGTNLRIDGSGVLSTTTSPAFTGAVTAPIYASTPQILTDATTIAWDPANGLNANVTLGGNRTLNFTTTPIAGSYGTLVVTQDATGGRTITLPSTANKVLGSTSTTTIALSSAANAKDILNFYYDGTNCYWNIGQGYGTAATSGTTNLASSVTGTLAVANGGTGAATLTGLVKGNGSGAMTAATAGTDYLAPTGSAASLTNFPTFNQNTTGTAANVTGTVAIANGGTGSTSLTANTVLLGNGTSALQMVAPGTSGNVLTSNGTTWSSSAPTASGVPYTGATGSVDLGAFDLTVNGLTIGRGKNGSGTNNNTNTALGYQVMNGQNGAGGGNRNTAAGSLAGRYLKDGDDNTAFGYSALANSVDPFFGNRNTAIGSFSLSANSYNSTSNNTAVGYNSLLNTRGDNNVSIGYNSGTTNTTGTLNTLIGPSANVGSGGLTNATAIGASATVSANNTIQLGNSSVTNVNTSGALTTGAVTYPIVHGTANQVLTTTGSGTLSWTTPASGGSSSIHTVGESYGGGIVFYTWDGGAHGLIGANTELNSGQAIAWGGGSGAYVGTPNFYGVLGGKINTQRILNVIPVPTYGNGDPQTGQRCAAYWAAIYMNAAVVVNGVTTTPQFSDWYLPNATELMLFATQSAYFPNCNFATHDHWTSCERTDYAYLAFALGANSTTYIYQDNKSSTKYVVAIRSF